MTEHFTRGEAVALAKAAGFDVRRGLGLRESVPEDVFARGLINEEVTALCNAAVTAKLKGWEAQGAVAYLAWKDGKPCYEGGDGVCEDAVWPLDDTDDRTSMPVYTHALPAQPAEPVNAELVKALKKLLEQYDELAEEDNSGWILAGELAKANHAREVLSRAQAAPAVGVPDVWKQAVMRAYGHLWHVNNEPMAPVPLYSIDSAGYEARKQLRDLLTTTERGQAINEVQAMLASAQPQQKEG